MLFRSLDVSPGGQDNAGDGAPAGRRVVYTLKAHENMFKKAHKDVSKNTHQQGSNFSAVQSVAVAKLSHQPNTITEQPLFLPRFGAPLFNPPVVRSFLAVVQSLPAVNLARATPGRPQAGSAAPVRH